MFKIGRLHFTCNKSLDYFDKEKANNADFRWDSSLRADSPESVLFAKTSILPLALKELKVFLYLKVSEPLQEGPRSDEYSLYQRDRGTNYPDIGSVRASSLESCWDECSKRVLCKALKFTQTQNMCTLYDGFLTDQTYPENGSDIWQADDSNWDLIR